MNKPSSFDDQDLRKFSVLPVYFCYAAL